VAAPEKIATSWRDSKSFCYFSYRQSLFPVKLFEPSYRLMRHFGIPRRNLSEAHVGQTPWNKGKKCPQLKGHPPTYFNKPNLDDELTLAYVLGVVEGDGCLYDDKHGEYIIMLEVRDEAFAKSFYNALKKLGLKPTFSYRHPPSWKNGKFRVRAWSKILFELLKQKYSELDSWLNDEELFKAFLRGFYESEGWLQKYKVQRKKRVWQYYGLGMCNVNGDLMNKIAEKLRDLGFNPKLYIRKPNPAQRMMKPLYILKLCRQTEVSRFLSTFKPCIKFKPRGEVIVSREN